MLPALHRWRTSYEKPKKAAARNAITAAATCDWSAQLPSFRAAFSNCTTVTALHNQSTRTLPRLLVAVCSLWESDELASRYIVEEGKLNLLLRMLYEHKSNACAADGDAVMRQAGEANGLNGSEIARAIERDAGTIIRCAFGHVEAMQTLDLPLLAEHLSLVLHHLAEDVAAGKAQDYTGQQEVLSVYYLERIGDQLEELGEDRAMEHFADKQLTRRLIRVLALDAPVYDRDTIVAATRALNAVSSLYSYSTAQFMTCCRSLIRNTSNRTLSCI